MVKDQKRWRLLRDFKKGKFCFLIGVDNWSIELQKSEFNSLYLLLLKINEQLLAIKDELMDEESIALELEKLLNELINLCIWDSQKPEAKEVEL